MLYVELWPQMKYSGNLHVGQHGFILPLQVHPTSSSVRSEDSSLAAFGSEAELPANAGKAAGGGADGAAAGGNSGAAPGAGMPSSEIKPAEEPAESGAAAGKMQRLTAELADEGLSPSQTFTGPALWSGLSSKHLGAAS